MKYQPPPAVPTYDQQQCAEKGQYDQESKQSDEDLASATCNHYSPCDHSHDNVGERPSHSRKDPDTREW